MRTKWIDGLRAAASSSASASLMESCLPVVPMRSNAKARLPGGDLCRRRFTGTSYCQISILAMAASAMMISNTQAAFEPTHVVVTHTTASNPPVTVLDTLTPPNSIDTIDPTPNGNGVRATLRGAVMSLRSQTTQVPNPAGFPASIPMVNAGTIDFTSDNAFSVAMQSQTYALRHDFLFALTNLTTQQHWKFGTLTGVVASYDITLPDPAPAGTYQLQWSQRSAVQTGVWSRGEFDMVMTAVPEPTCALFAAMLGCVARRATRRDAVAP